jgi:hypothetical protein
MMVLNNKCKECNSICNTIHFQHKFIDWTSGNNDIDKFIQDTQLSAHSNSKIANALEWIPYDRLCDITKNKFGKVYKANWIDGKIMYWNNKNKNWKRHGSKDVILKSLSNLKNIRIKFIMNNKV